ncbi:hypothetical protein MTO96_028113 [Rhipicephalus appendiculatus]
MGCQLSTMLDRLHPERAPERSPRFTEALPASRTFQPEDPVFARNFSQGPPWVSAAISNATGPISYEVVLPDGHVCHWHVDKLRRRSSSPIRVAETVPAAQPEVRPASSPSRGEMSRSETEDHSEPEEPPTAMLPSDDVATPQPAPPEESRTARPTLLASVPGKHPNTSGTSRSRWLTVESSELRGGGVLCIDAIR